MLGKVFGTAMTGAVRQPARARRERDPVEVEIPVLPCNGGEAILRRCFEPLGYEVDAAPIELDERFPDWGESRYLRGVAAGVVRVADLLSHLYVLLPVLDNDKHYWVGEDEVDKLLDQGRAVARLASRPRAASSGATCATDAR